APGRSRGRGAPMSHHGTVKSWVGDKGFGFLLPDGGGEDVFVHRSALIGAEELLPGDKVIFDIRDAHAARISAGRGQLIDAAPPWFKAVNVSESLSPPASGCFGGLFEDAPGRPAPAGDVGAAIAAFLEAAAAGGGVCGEGAGELLERFVFESSLGHMRWRQPPMPLFHGGFSLRLLASPRDVLRAPRVRGDLPAPLSDSAGHSSAHDLPRSLGVPSDLADVADSQHTEREAQSPFSPLVDFRWLSAQGEYMKELQAATPHAFQRAARLGRARQVLGVAEGAHRDAIEGSFRRLSVPCRPDKAPAGLTAAEAVARVQRWKDLCDAKSLLLKAAAHQSASAVLAPPQASQPSSILPPLGLASLDEGAGSAEVAAGDVRGACAEAPQRTLHLALECLLMALEQGASSAEVAAGDVMGACAEAPQTTLNRALERLILALRQGASFAKVAAGDVMGACAEAPQTTLNLVLECILLALQQGAVDGLTLAPAHAADGTRGHWELGLLVHLEGEGRIGLLRRIMESARIVKVMWGVRGDCESLLYQHWPVQLAVTPEAIVDAKAAFLGLGMGKMLAHVPPEHLEGLPQKEQIDFDSAHAANREALPLPLGLTAARYAVDDLHRIEAILLHKLPRSGSYAEARSATDSLLAALRGDPCGLESLPRRATATPGRCWAAPSGSPTPRCAPRASPCRQTSPSPGAAERRRDSRTSSAL
ncbi:unnamed protein product, partial [Prorocentrum cordatum]